MIEIDKYISTLIKKLNQHFSSNLLYVGLQGSYFRGEANDNSDIDIMVVLKKLELNDLTEYRKIIQSIDYSEKSCGFICSEEDLKNWNPLEICHLKHTTKDYFGCLSDLIPGYSTIDILNFIKISINNLYHEICHRYIHSTFENNLVNLPYSYKNVFFILQNIYFIKTGNFAITKNELLSLSNSDDYKILKYSLDIQNNTNFDFEDYFSPLLKWCQQTLIEINKLTTQQKLK